MDAGLAVLHGFDPQTGNVTTDLFHERADAATTSPWHRAEALKKSVEGDFPGWIWSIGQNRRSHYLMYAANMVRVGLGEHVDAYEDWKGGDDG